MIVESVCLFYLVIFFVHSYALKKWSFIIYLYGGDYLRRKLLPKLKMGVAST